MNELETGFRVQAEIDNKLEKWLSKKDFWSFRGIIPVHPEKRVKVQFFRVFAVNSVGENTGVL